MAPGCGLYMSKRRKTTYYIYVDCILIERRLKEQFGWNTLFCTEPEEPGPVFFEALPPAGFSGARTNSSYGASSLERLTEQLQVNDFHIAQTKICQNLSHVRFNQL